MTISLLERGAAALGDLVEQVAFVGGAAVVLWITDPGAPPPRPTKDVDVVIEVTTPNAYYDFEARLRSRGRRPVCPTPPAARSRRGPRSA